VPFYLIFAIVKLYLSAWSTAKYNANHNLPSLSARFRVRYPLFMSVWTIVFAAAYLVGFFVSLTWWTIRAVLTLMLAFVFIRGVQSSKRGDGLKGSMVEGA